MLANARKGKLPSVKEHVLSLLDPLYSPFKLCLALPCCALPCRAAAPQCLFASLGGILNHQIPSYTTMEKNTEMAPLGRPCFCPVLPCPPPLGPLSFPCSSEQCWDICDQVDRVMVSRIGCRASVAGSAHPVQHCSHHDHSRAPYGPIPQRALELGTSKRTPQLDHRIGNN